MNLCGTQRVVYALIPISFIFSTFSFALPCIDACCKSSNFNFSQGWMKIGESSDRECLSYPWVAGSNKLLRFIFWIKADTKLPCHKHLLNILNARYGATCTKIIKDKSEVRNLR